VKKYSPIILILIGAYLAWDRGALDATVSQSPGSSDTIFAQAFENRTSGLQLEGRGGVIKVLPDDNDGSRHQRFILELGSGQRILVAHNIDLAPRISALKKGSDVAFFGEYEWNAKGGVVHWTHHHSKGRDASGWLKHNGHTYE
jgi:hypothetical protein